MSSGGGPRGVARGQGSQSGPGLDSFEARLKALQGPVPEALPLSEVERRLAVRRQRREVSDQNPDWQLVAQPVLNARGYRAHSANPTASIVGVTYILHTT